MSLRRVLPLFVVKELKEVLRDRTLLFNLVISPMLGVVVWIVVVEAVFAGSITPQTGSGGIPGIEGLAVVDLDGTPLSQAVATALGAAAAGSVEEALQAGYKMVLVIPEGFASTLQKGEQARLELYIQAGEVLRSQGLLGFFRYSGLAGALEGAVDLLAKQALGIPPAEDLVRVEEKPLGILEGNPASHLLVLFMLLMASFITGSFLLQVSAITVGYDREQRTLELLLATPLRTRGYVAVRLAGAASMASVGLLSLAASLLIMMVYAAVRIPQAVGGGVTSGELASLLGEAAERLAPTPGQALVALASIAVAALYTLTLGLILGFIGAGDVKSAQTASGMSVFILFILLLPLAAIPFRLPHAIPLALHPITAAPSAYLAYANGDNAMAIGMLASTLAGSALAVAAAARLSRPERLLALGSGGGGLIGSLGLRGWRTRPRE
ncbi:hypothetical protein apy_01160 [Aeropyrum pernix]|uniref:ABC-2 type transporter transmembrane domain-containing protein n=1 Tax=Aeropyrum pernix TaxID=56636 RepID=A0A401H7K6_AERPX|nr:ABC transporter permease [Aeropyrum pernix]GBF08391.1 hypothetical protein apy_01160 [Aeropyrum pernix]